MLLLQCVDAGLAAVVFTVPLIMGGRVALGQLVLTALAVWVAVCWCLRQCLASGGRWVRTATGPLTVAALVLVGLQLVPLPPALLSVLSPHVYETLPLWASDGDSSATLGLWTTLSLTPGATRHGFVLLAAFGLLLLTTVQRVRRIEDVERLLRWIAVSTVVMAGFALVQYLMGNGKYFWFFDPPFQHAQANVSSIPIGSFTNRNHFAQFIALGIGPLIWWIYSGLHDRSKRESGPSAGFASDSRRRELKTGLRCLALAFCGFVALMSLSRGGAVAMLAAATVCLLALYRGSLIGRKSVLAVIGTGAFLVACLWIHGSELVVARLGDFQSLETLDPWQVRQQLWRASSRGFADFPLTGSGLGSHREVYPLYCRDGPTSSGNVEFTHSESGYLQSALETGTAGLTLLLIAVGLCGYWCLGAFREDTPRRARLCLGAIAASLVASFLHSAVDFVWYVPGCMIAVVLPAGCACRLSQLTRRSGGESATATPIPRLAWVAAAACLAVVGACMIRYTWAGAMAEPAWNRYLRLSRARSLPAKMTPHERLQSMTRELATTLKWRPDHARAHSRMASAQLRLFDHPEDVNTCPMGLVQVREAALASQFESSAALHEWLDRAFGRRREHLTAALQHARRAAALGPMQGEVYLYLAELSFLEGPRAPGKAVYTQQALRVRPSDGDMLFAAGQEAVLAGDFDLAMEHWRASFRTGTVHQDRLIRTLAGQVPADFLVKIFRPDLPVLKRIMDYYRELNLPEDLRSLRLHYAHLAEHEALRCQGKTAAQRWVEAAGAYCALEDLPQGVRCLRKAVRCHGLHYQARRALGIHLCEMKEFAEAEQHLRWCLQRDPQDRPLRRKLEVAVEKRLRLAARNSPAP